MGSVAFTSDHCNNNRHVIGIHLQQCLITTLALYIPVVVLWWYSGPLLVLFGQGTALAYGTQDFLRWLSPFGIGYIWFEALKKFLQCQRKKNRCFPVSSDLAKCFRYSTSWNGYTPYCGLCEYPRQYSCCTQDQLWHTRRCSSYRKYVLPSVALLLALHLFYQRITGMGGLVKEMFCWTWRVLPLGVTGNPHGRRWVVNVAWNCDLETSLIVLQVGFRSHCCRRWHYGSDKHGRSVNRHDSGYCFCSDAFWVTKFPLFEWLALLTVL